MPGIPEIAEREVMKEIGNYYGKIISTWVYLSFLFYCNILMSLQQVDKDPLPIGPPRLMVSVTNEQVANKALLEQLDKSTGIKMEDRRKARENTVICRVKPAEVDAWERGEKIDFDVQRVPM